ncbi:MAG: M28 family peptidase [Cyclobacteriaceae bacterium]
MKKILCVLGVFVAVGVMAQDKKAMKYAKTIKAEDLKAHLSILASDEYEGRETGKKGQKMAAAYIADYFKKLGLEAPVDGSYYQSFDLTESSIASVYFKKGDEMKVGFEDFVYYSRAETSGEEYVNVIVADEEDSMKKKYKNSYVAYRVEALGGLQDRINLAKEEGAKGFLVILETEKEFESTMSRFGPYLKRPSLGLDSRNNDSDKMIIVDKSLAAWMFDKDYEKIEAGDKAQLIFNADYLDKPVGTENVLGFLKGTEKPDEVIVITSHYDHIGITNGEINNGANDDGSGTVTVLELAEAFTAAAAKNAGPKRSILFMTVTGEEKGLLGSRYYTDTDPIFPLENTVTNLNIDMVGRVDEKHADNPDFIYVIGSDKLSQELHDLSEAANKTYTNLELDYTYNDENDPNRFYYRSDHYNFAKNNVPIIFYFNGTHPDYHKPTDTVEKINFDAMQKVARLVFHTGWEIANREGRIKADPEKVK